MKAFLFSLLLAAFGNPGAWADLKIFERYKTVLPDSKDTTLGSYLFLLKEGSGKFTHHTYGPAIGGTFSVTGGSSSDMLFKAGADSVYYLLPDEKRYWSTPVADLKKTVENLRKYRPSEVYSPTEVAFEEKIFSGKKKVAGIASRHLLWTWKNRVKNDSTVRRYLLSADLWVADSFPGLSELKNFLSAQRPILGPSFQLEALVLTAGTVGVAIDSFLDKVENLSGIPLKMTLKLAEDAAQEKTGGDSGKSLFYTSVLTLELSSQKLPPKEFEIPPDYEPFFSTPIFPNEKSSADSTYPKEER